MATLKNWGYFIYVNLGFALGVMAIIFFSSIQEIKDNWPEYRCNPMYMPLSDNVGQDFSYCVQNMQVDLMGYLLEPVTYIIQNIVNLSAEFTASLQYVREMFDYIRTFFANIFGNIFGVFMNLMIEFQKIGLGIKDLVGKIIGIMVTMMYIMETTVNTGKSAWNGPPGQMLKALGGACFHPETLVKLKTGETVEMQNINLGDVLENGSVVKSVMKINNDGSEAFYKIKSQDINSSDIYVTGSHLVYDKASQKFVLVENYANAEKQEKINTEWFSCLITSDHKIHIGPEIFWDWDDYIIKLGLFTG